MKKEIITPALSILNEYGKFDEAGNKLLIEHLIDNGVNGILLLGSSGEFNKFSAQEKREIVDFYLKTVNNRVKVIVGSTSFNFEDTVSLSNYSLERGASGVMILGEFYFKMSQEHFFHYFNEICKSVEGDVYIYNYPNNVGNDIEAETILQILKENKNLVGIKDTVADFSHTKRILELILPKYPNFKVYSGYDNQFVENVKNNGSGNISALSNIAPDLWSNWVKAFNQEDKIKFDEISNQINGLMELYTLDTNLFNTFKHMLKYVGLDISTETKFPFDNLSEEQIKKGYSIIDKFYKK